jgi:hypothetical protein
MEELQAMWEVNASKVCDIVGQAEIVLAPLSFCPVRSRGSSREVRKVLLMLDSAGDKILMLDEVISDQLEAEGHVLVEKVADHMLMCFRS